ncbi:MAG: hypothetical protein M3P06_20220 [Acidobacteriota bacterium]|nr:hypothetical protein [Acidobacteriota bacterium]
MEPTYVVAQLNARLQPLDRGEFFEDPLEQVLADAGVGSISGGGTLQAKSGEIEYCDIEIELTTYSERTIRLIVDALERLAAPKGSKLHLPEERQLSFGRAEGLAVYLNGTDLPDETYKSCDSNFVYSEFDRLLSGVGHVFSHWQGPNETALYMYGEKFSVMRDRLENFLASYPLCERARVEQIA